MISDNIYIYNIDIPGSSTSIHMHVVKKFPPLVVFPNWTNFFKMHNIGIGPGQTMLGKNAPYDFP
jgi:hypothetical protein